MPLNEMQHDFARIGSPHCSSSFTIVGTCLIIDTVLTGSSRSQAHLRFTEKDAIT